MPEMEAYAANHLTQLAQLIHGLALRVANLTARSAGLVQHTRLEGAKVFTESLVFYAIIDLKIFKELVSLWNKCLHQIHYLKGFKEDFNMSQLDLGKDKRLQPYDNEDKVIDVPIDNVFYSLLPPEAMDPFIMAARFIPLSESDVSGIPSQAGEPSSQLANPVFGYLIASSYLSAVRLQPFRKDW
ncbi:hypothetical protein Salat_1876300 [Sesamum alatum]|uniref:Uncharacterized protein n=1 Tax=Sesamum alatum TaxID=300844 RepID=A0AAE1Y430_9LAMI|nr:hypothetical protein Salat_1876300 [Sesamum alatum]